MAKHITKLFIKLLTKVFASVLSQWKDCNNRDAIVYYELRSYRSVCRKYKFKIWTFLRPLIRFRLVTSRRRLSNDCYHEDMKQIKIFDQIYNDRRTWAYINCSIYSNHKSINVLDNWTTTHALDNYSTRFSKRCTKRSIACCSKRIFKSH